MVQPTPAPSDGHAALPDFGEPSQPQGLGLTALALAALIVIYFIRRVLHLFGGTLTLFPVFEQLMMCGGTFLELLLIWHYWKGQNWSRIFVLLWSLFVAVRALSFLVDHNLDPTALMSHPLSFFHALLAVFLLYWLNTSAVRAWFKKTSATEADLIAEQLVGKLCTALDFHPTATNSNPVWSLTFEHGAELTLSCPWRIVLDDNLAFTSAPAAGSGALTATPPLPNTSVPDPSAAPDYARRLLQNLRVTAVHLAPRTSDLFLTFEMGIQLQTWNPGPAAGSAALPNTHVSSPTPLWRFSDPALTVTANAEGLSSQLVAPPASSSVND
jgi:hypothetical protein